MSATPSFPAAESIVPGASGTSVANADSASRLWLDRVGIGASVACAVHCMLAPFLMLLLPVAGSVWAHPAVHWLLAVLVLPLALWVVYCGYRKHGKRHTLVAAGLGAGLIVAGLIAPMVSAQPLFTATLPTMGMDFLAGTNAPAHACSETCCPSVSQSADTGSFVMTFPPGGLITLVGSLLLVLAHATNLLACRCFSKSRACGDASCGCPA